VVWNCGEPEIAGQAADSYSGSNSKQQIAIAVAIVAVCVVFSRLDRISQSTLRKRTNFSYLNATQTDGN
jgi:hypothetical protein